MQKHEAFILDTVLPAIADHSRQTRCNMDDAVFAVFLTLGIILQSEGFTHDELLLAIKAGATVAHDSPGGLQ